MEWNQTKIIIKYTKKMKLAESRYKLLLYWQLKEQFTWMRAKWKRNATFEPRIEAHTLKSLSRLVGVTSVHRMKKKSANLNIRLSCNRLWLLFTQWNVSKIYPAAGTCLEQKKTPIQFSECFTCSGNEVNKR